MSEAEWAAISRANRLRSPLPEATFGLDRVHAWHGPDDGGEGERDRVQFSASYEFYSASRRRHALDHDHRGRLRGRIP